MSTKEPPKPACFRCAHYEPTSVTKGNCWLDSEWTPRWVAKVDAMAKCASYRPKETP